MSPLFALLICALSVWALLSVERNGNREPSGAVWIPLLWLLVAASKPLGTWFGTAGGDEGSELDQYFGVTVFLLGLGVLSRRRFSWSAAAGANVWLASILMYMLLSVLWSDIPVSAFKRWGREVIAVVMACVVASERDPRQAMEAILRRLTYILVPTSLLLIKYFPYLGTQYRWAGGQMWIGVALQKNGLGRLCMIAAFFLIWSLVRTRHLREVPDIRRRRRADMLVLGLAVYLLIGPGDDQYSATSLTAMSVGLATYALILLRRKRGFTLGRPFALTAMLALVAFGILQPFGAGKAIGEVASGLGRDVTLTGRTEIWSGLAPVALANPVLGSGIASFWTDQTKMTHDIGEAHNGYLDVVLNLGFPGLFLIAMFLFSCCVRAQREMSQDFHWGCLWYCFLMIAATHNITESSINSFTKDLTAILLFFSLALTSAESWYRTVSASGERGPPVNRNRRGAA